MLLGRLSLKKQPHFQLKRGNLSFTNTINLASECQIIQVNHKANKEKGIIKVKKEPLKSRGGELKFSSVDFLLWIVDSPAR